MLTLLFLFARSEQEIEPESNGFFSNIWNTITTRFQAISYDIYHVEKSSTKLPIKISKVNVRQSSETFSFTSVDTAAERIAKYGFDKKEILAKLKKTGISKSFKVEFNNFAMDIPKSSIYTRYSQMQRIIASGEKVNGVTKLKLNYTGANAEVESKVIETSTGKLFGVSTASSQKCLFRPLEPSELEKIYNTLEYSIKNHRSSTVYHKGLESKTFRTASSKTNQIEENVGRISKCFHSKVRLPNTPRKRVIRIRRY